MGTHKESVPRARSDRPLKELPDSEPATMRGARHASSQTTLRIRDTIANRPLLGEAHSHLVPFRHFSCRGVQRTAAWGATLEIDRGEAHTSFKALNFSSGARDL